MLAREGSNETFSSSPLNLFDHLAWYILCLLIISLFQVISYYLYPLDIFPFSTTSVSHMVCFLSIVLLSLSSRSHYLCHPCWGNSTLCCYLEVKEGWITRNNGKKKGSSRFLAAFRVRQSHLYSRDLLCAMEGILILRNTCLSENLQILSCKVRLSVYALAYILNGWLA